MAESNRGPESGLTNAPGGETHQLMHYHMCSGVYRPDEQ